MSGHLDLLLLYELKFILIYDLLKLLIRVNLTLRVVIKSISSLALSVVLFDLGLYLS